VQQAGMLSIPRDTFAGDIDAPSYKDKINAVAARESPEEMMRVVNKITGLDIKYYAVVDTKVLIELVDIIRRN
jgi:anionic cell wall polymer biosynthesis LytR-Cps2A-Psr (LCP) family protein